MKKEIGGYFELEQQTKTDCKEYHNFAVPINLARNAITYLVSIEKIKLIYLPYYLCESVKHTCISAGVRVKQYHINSNFLPIINRVIRKDEYVYIVNYYGILTNKVLFRLKKQYKNIIVDNVQSFFTKPLINIPTIYSCRKFFGVPDGAYIYTNKTIRLSKDNSSNRFKHLFGRLEKGAKAFFEEYLKNESLLSTLPLLSMSSETHSIMNKIAYKNVKGKRTRNFNYLHRKLSKNNKIKTMTIHGAYCYPFLVDNGKLIRKRLINNNVYVPVLWPNLDGLNILEQNLVNNLLILPCDQRYGVKEMRRIIDLIYEN